jgi:hypothetical protein
MREPRYVYSKAGLLTAYGFRTGRQQGVNGRRAESSVAWMYLEADFYGDAYVVRWLGSPDNLRRFHAIGDARAYLLRCPGVDRLSKAWDTEVGERHLLPQAVERRRAHPDD